MLGVKNVFKALLSGAEQEEALTAHVGGDGQLAHVRQVSLVLHVVPARLLLVEQSRALGAHSLTWVWGFLLAVKQLEERVTGGVLERVHVVAEDDVGGKVSPAIQHRAHRRLDPLLTSHHHLTAWCSLGT